MEIFVTPRAERSFHAIVTRIQEKWGENTVNVFIKKVDRIFKLLSVQPNLGKAEMRDI